MKGHMTRDFNQRRRGDVRPPSRNQSSSRYREEQPPRPPRFNRERGDRASDRRNSDDRRFNDRRDYSDSRGYREERYYDRDRGQRRGYQRRDAEPHNRPSRDFER